MGEKKEEKEKNERPMLKQSKIDKHTRIYTHSLYICVLLMHEIFEYYISVCFFADTFLKHFLCTFSVYPRILVFTFFHFAFFAAVVCVLLFSFASHYRSPSSPPPLSSSSSSRFLFSSPSLISRQIRTRNILAFALFFGLFSLPYTFVKLLDNPKQSVCICNVKLVYVVS